jgi:putative transposase
VLAMLTSERFMDQAPREVWATLLDEGVHLCSVRTMYRLLAQTNSVRERRNVRRHCNYKKPELMAVRPNEVWSWDITKLKGPSRGEYYCLYVIIDLFSRLVVGWLLAHSETGDLAERLIKESCRKQGVEAGQLTIHADRGAPMKSKTVNDLLVDLGVVRSHSRPHVSNDNAFSEAGFKTMKYSPTFPERFASIEEAEAFLTGYFQWYNAEHHHTGIALLTPEQVHYADPSAILRQRHATLLAAYERNPGRFGGRPPHVDALPHAVWINPPAHPAVAQAQP